ncbi:hypothetical protein LguiA_000590 [Lonicera macranthoides]
MVILGEGREREAEKLITMPPERSKPLHNFRLPLSWGARRFLRCVKVNPNAEVTAVDRKSTASSSSEDERSFGHRKNPQSERRGSSDRRESFKVFSPSPVVGCSGRKSVNGTEAVRTKVIFDLQTAADKLKDAILREGMEAEPTATDIPAAERPWNLRTRRAKCKEPNGTIACGNVGGNDGAGKSFKADILKPNFSPLRNESKSSRLRGSVIGSGEKREREKFSVSLSRQEIEEDFMAMTRQRLPRRPKKRTKTLQKELDMLFPGLWLTEVNAETYKVPDVPDTGKRQ